MSNTERRREPITRENSMASNITAACKVVEQQNVTQSFTTENKNIPANTGSVGSIYLRGEEKSIKRESTASNKSLLLTKHPVTP